MEILEMRQYIIFPMFRTMNAGKLAAQAAHAANKMRKEITERDPEEHVVGHFYRWEADCGAGTTIVLQGDQCEIHAAFQQVNEHASFSHTGIWVDPTYPFLFNGQPTVAPQWICGYAFGAAHELGPIMNNFKLHP